jgi:hypothetical protein
MEPCSLLTNSRLRRTCWDCDPLFCHTELTFACVSHGLAATELMRIRHVWHSFHGLCKEPLDTSSTESVVITCASAGVPASIFPSSHLCSKLTMSSMPTPCTSPPLSLTVSGSKGRPPARTGPPTKFLKSNRADHHLAGCHSLIKLGHEPNPIQTGQRGDAYWRLQKSHSLSRWRRAEEGQLC